MLRLIKRKKKRGNFLGVYLHNNPQVVHQLKSCFIIMDNKYISQKCRMIIKNSAGLSLVKITFDQSNVKKRRKKNETKRVSDETFHKDLCFLSISLAGLLSRTWFN